MRNFFAVSTLFFALLLYSCGGEASSPSSPEDGRNTAPSTGTAPENAGERVSVAGGEFTRLSPIELREMKDAEDFPLVNVHVPFAGDIPGTDLSIPYNEVEANLDKLPANKDAKIVLYCQGGPMSLEAAETLVGLGYTNVSDLDGGMEAWQREGHQLNGV